ncbi:MAG: threonine synthase [Chloroflexota bacterium]|nr:threonine synthase [Chloroflexota bacterium]
MIAFCPTSKFQITAELSPLRCPMTAHPLEFDELPRFDPGAIDADQPGHWRYTAMLPIGERRERTTLSEGWTPLLADYWAGRPVWWKFDALMPTGSYKDRGISVMVNWLAGLGVETMVDDSSGNAGASLACYAARAGLRARIFVPSSAPQPKKAQIAVYGAELVEVPGPRDLATRAAEADTQGSRETAYASHAWHPAFLLGQMTCAWEIWEQLGRRVPDWLVAPVGHGGALLGTWRGFQHLYNSQVTTSLPRLIAVQADPYTPVYEAFHKQVDEVEATPRLGQISADGIAISYPVRAGALLKAIRHSHGAVVAVSEDEVLTTQTRLAQRGLFVEPTSATVAVAIEKMRTTFGKEESVVAILTGHGLKNPPKV